MTIERRTHRMLRTKQSPTLSTLSLPHVNLTQNTTNSQVTFQMSTLQVHHNGPDMITMVRDRSEMMALRFTGCSFEPWLGIIVWWPWASNLHLCASAIKQYNLVPAKRSDLFGWESNCGPGGK